VRVFSLWIPLIAFCTVMIFQLLLPNHLDRQFNFVNVTAALLGIVATLLLAPRYKALGVAWSAVAVQLYSACLLPRGVASWVESLRACDRCVGSLGARSACADRGEDTKRNLKQCAGRPARSRWCKSITVKV
jgi:hypothetical protein